MIFFSVGKASRSKKEFDNLLTPEVSISELSDSPNKTGLLQRTFVHIFLICSLGFLAYSNSFHSPFQWDDIKHIIGNPVIKDLDNFTLNTIAYEFNPRRFIGYLTFALNYHFGGSGVTGYHAVNLLIHLINAILVYFLVITTFRTPYFISDKEEVRSKETEEGIRKSKVIDGRIDGSSVRNSVLIIQNAHLIALFSALFFVLHPIQTQAVTYVVQRFASLATLFYLLSLVMYIKARERQVKTEAEIKKEQIKAEAEVKCKNNQDSKSPSGRFSISTLTLTFFVLSLLSAVLAVMTKEIAFTLPVMIVLYEIAFFRSSIKRKLLFIMPIALILIVIILGLYSYGKSLENELLDLSKITRLQTDMPRGDYLFTQMRVITTYIRLILLPINQNFDYDYPIERSLFTLPVFSSFLFLLSLFGLAIYLFPRSRLISVGIMWFFVTLSLESSIIPIRDVIFEHRVYLPSVGLLTGITTGVFIVSHRFKMEKIVLPVLILVVLLLSGATYARNTVWRSKISLWEDVVRKSPNKARAHNNLGVFYCEEGYLDKGGSEFQAAIKLKPGYADAHYNMGTVYLASGHLDEAFREFQVVIKLKPDYANAHHDLGIVYEKLGRVEDAIKEYQTTLQINPNHDPALKNLGRHSKMTAEKR